MNIVFCKPWEGELYITQTFAEHVAWAKAHPGVQYNGGLDVAPAWGYVRDEHEIRAAAKGKVTRVRKDTTGYGRHVLIDHGNGWQTLYGHMDQIYVKEGDVVASGDALGTMGNTGNSTGKHLHFEMRLNGKPVDPEKYIDKTVEPEEQPEEQPVKEMPAFPALPKARVIVDMLSMRSGPGVNNVRIGSLKYGDTVEVIRAVADGDYIWLQIGRNQYCCMLEDGDYYVEWIQ